MKNDKTLLHKLKSLWGDREAQSQYWTWMVSHAKPYMPRILVVLFINLSVSLIGVGMAIISKQIIDTATNNGGSILWMIGLYVACVFVNLGMGVVSSLISIMLSERFSFSIRKQVYEKIIHSHWMDVQKYHTGDLMTRLTSDASNVADGIIGVVPDIIKLVLELIVVFFTLFYFSSMLAIFALILAPLAAIASFVFGQAIKKLQLKVQESEAAYRSFLQESLANLLIVKSFANEDYATQRLVDLRDQRFYWVLKKSRLGLAASTMMSVTFQLGYITAFAYGALQISKKLITYGTMSVFLTLVNRVQGPILQLASDIPKLVAILASAGRIMELQNIPTEEKAEKNLTARQVGISISNLTFGYTESAVLENAAVEILPGEFAAVVGESGVGKTTLVHLLMSFMSSVQGRIEFYNDRNEREKSNAGVREFVSYVPQGNTLFSGTIRENIRMGKLDATDAEMLEALQLSAVCDFVMGLPHGLDTAIGERGHGLSEGQAQRIAIARALVKKAPVLIMDEATSALDEKTELQVLEGIRKLEPRPTCLLITHRRSVLKYCDREIKIEDKQVLKT